MRAIRNIFVLINLLALVGVSSACEASPPPYTPTTVSTYVTPISPTSTITATITMLPTEEKEVISLYDECRKVVDGLYNLRKDLKLTDDLQSGNPSRNDFDFDPNQYFQFLTHVNIEAGYKLDFVYYKDELGGAPLVYAREINAVPFQSYVELLNSYGEDMSDVGLIVYQYLPHHRDFLKHIQIDDTPEGYFEYIVLWDRINQFYLWKRGLYNDSKILCDPNDMKYVYEDLRSFGLELPNDVIDSLKNIDFSPRAIIDEETITIRFISFTKWSGLFEDIFVIKKDSQGILDDIKFKNLIKYYCGVEF